MTTTRNSGAGAHAGVSLLMAAWAALAICLPSGCNYIILAGYLIGGPPSIEPEFDAMTKKSMTDKDVTTLVVCYAPPEIRRSFALVDKELEKYVSYRLAQHHIKVVPPDLVRAWLDENPEWDKPEEIGKAFNSTYVIYIDLNDYTLYEENSATLYRGRADAIVSVFEMDQEGTGEKIYDKELHSIYPILEPRDTADVTYSTFKQQYLSRLSEEIGRQFYEYYNGDDIPEAT
jgi:hypothetical protein